MIGFWRRQAPFTLVLLQFWLYVETDVATASVPAKSCDMRARTHTDKLVLTGGSEN